MLLGRITALFLLAAAQVIAGPSLTTIQDVIYKADGTRFNGSAVISWTPFDAADTSVIGQQTVTVQITNGALFAQLVPTTNATPAALYTVDYQSTGRMQFEEKWAVPPSTNPLRVRDVRLGATLSTGGGGTPGAAAPITEDAVVGLTADLSVRPVKGPGYSNGRAALVNDTGGIESVAGNLSDCVHVDGTSGACFDPSQLPSFSDAETPGGVVDGANMSFTLAGVPNPPASLQLYRNGVAMNPGADYVLTGSTVTFVSAATPQPADTLLAWYRQSTAGGLAAGGLTGGSGVTVFTPEHSQVLCSAEGSSTTSVTPVSLGHCTIPAGVLQAGDRVEVRATIIHQGGLSSSNLMVNWGGSSLVTRVIAPTDSVFTLKGDAALTSANAIWTGQSYGQTTAMMTAANVSNAPFTAGIKIDFLVDLAVLGTADSVTLANYTVIRFPAISHP